MFCLPFLNQSFNFNKLGIVEKIYRSTIISEKNFFKFLKNEDEKWRRKKWTSYPFMLWTSFSVQRYFEPCWFKIYNYFFHIYIASKVTAYWRWSIGVKKQQKTGFFDSNELPYRGCNFWCSKAVEKIIIFLESEGFKVPLYQKWSL